MVDRSGGQLAFRLSENDKASFENFYVGDNEELVRALRSVFGALHGVSEFKLLYFYGAQGSGKSHLLFSLMREVQKQGRQAHYVSLQDQYVAPQMLDSIDLHSVVCVDNIDAWVAEQEKERALFALFEQIKHAGGQLVISANQAPENCGFELKDLVSRLSSGLIYGLLGLNDTQRMNALQLRAQQRGMVINDDVLKYLLNRVSRDNNELFALLDTIDQASLAEKRKITIPFLQKILN